MSEKENWGQEDSEEEDEDFKEEGNPDEEEENIGEVTEKGDLISAYFNSVINGSDDSDDDDGDFGESDDEKDEEIPKTEPVPQPFETEEIKEIKQEEPAQFQPQHSAEQISNTSALDEEGFIPLRKRTEEEKKADNEKINNWMMNILGNAMDSDDDSDDGDFNTIQFSKKRKNAKIEHPVPVAEKVEKEESDTESLYPYEIIRPLEKIIEAIGTHKTASEAICDLSFSKEQIIEISSLATRLLFLGVADIYDMPIENIKQIIGAAHSKGN